MAYFRSHWTRSANFDPVRRDVEEWARTESVNVPGFVGVWFTDDYEDPEFRWVTVETEDPSAFGSPALGKLTATLSQALGEEVRTVDSEDVSYVEADDAGDSAEKAYRSVWFETDDAQKTAETIAAWQRRHVDRGSFEKTWLVRERDGSRIHSLSAEFPSKDVLYGGGIQAFDEAVAELGNLIAGEPEKHCVSGGVEIAAAR